MKIKIAVLLQCILLCTQTVSAVNIEMVTVGNPGNAPDPPLNRGSVNYVYQIGKYEITAGQYTEFLNAVAMSDPNELYSTAMDNSGGVSQGANIQRFGTSPNFTYSVAAEWANRPVNYVSFWDAARFCNWLHKGQPSGPQGPDTTENGAYHDVGNQVLFGRNPDARFFIPTVDEWYKAAYHDKAAGLAASYFAYPTGSNTVPGNNISETTTPGNNANYFVDILAIGVPYYRSVAGEFELSDSPYGTFDQGGNVLEWNETKVRGSLRVIRGGSYMSSDGSLRRDDFSSPLPQYEHNDLGFRVASIPEPYCFLLCSSVVVMLGVSRLRTRRGKSS